jgi:antimicrobial peptide system SdpB family protein
VAIAILLVVASGWRPRITGVLHAYVAWSFSANALMLDGGDQVAACLAFILVPVTLSDPRKWHWSAPPARTGTASDDLMRVIAQTALLVARIQVAGVYFQAFVGKLVVPEWVNGTALWYWLLHPDLGASTWLAPAARVVLSTPAVAPLTWGVLILEAALTVALVLPKKRWAPLLALGFALHAGIFVVHGLMSFMLSMFAALILYLRPTERVFRFPLRVARRSADEQESVSPALQTAAG